MSLAVIEVPVQAHEQSKLDAARFVARSMRPQIGHWEAEYGIAPGVLDTLRSVRMAGDDSITELTTALGRCGSLGALLAGITVLHADELIEACGLRSAAPGLSTLTAAFDNAQPELSFALEQDGSRTLSGHLPNVVSAQQARRLLVHVAANELALIDLTASGVHIVDTPDVGCHAAGLARVQFERVAIAPGHYARVSGALFTELDTEQRLRMARGLCAWSQALFDDTFDFVSSRRFAAGRLVDQQVVRHRLADIIARQKLLEAQLARAERSAPGERALAALFVAEVLSCTLPQLVKDCQQLHGGRGFLSEYWVSRAYRDVLCLGVLLGPVHTLRERIAERLSPSWRLPD